MVSSGYAVATIAARRCHMVAAEVRACFRLAYLTHIENSVGSELRSVPVSMQCSTERLTDFVTGGDAVVEQTD